MTVAERDHDIMKTVFGALVRMPVRMPARRARRWLCHGLGCGLLVALLTVAAPAMAAVSDWDEPTQSLFAAIEAGDLVRVQRAVLDGADVRATDDTGKNAAELAEELGHFTITHFLLAYSALEAPPEEPDEPTETVQAAPEPPDAAEAADSAEIGEPSTEEIVSPGTGEPTPERIESSYFERLSELNPPPKGTAEPPASTSVGVLRPDPQAEPEAGPDAGSESAGETVVSEPAPTPDPPDPPVPAVTESEVVEVVPETGEPAPAPRKPAIGEETVVAMVPAPAPGEVPGDVPGDVPDEDADAVPGDERGTPEIADAPPPAGSSTAGTGAGSSAGTAETMTSGGSFIANLRRIEGGAQGSLTPEDIAAEPPGEETFVAEIPGAESYPAPAGDARDTRTPQTDERVPEHEILRREALERLRRESAERLEQLDEARRAAADEREVEDKQRLFQAGVANVEAEARAQKRLELTGTPYPPGFVPPPDGGSSAVRFLQRMGLADAQQTSIAQAPATGLAKPPTPNPETGIMGPVATADPADAVTPQDLRALTFIDSGYAPPPSGRNIDTDDDRSLNALQQIARLLSTPDQKFPATGTAPGSDHTMSTVPEVALPSAPDVVQPAPPGDVPLPSAAFEDLIAGETENTLPSTPLENAPYETDPLGTGPVIAEGWGATATDPTGDVLAAAPPSAAPGDPQSGLVDRLSGLFDPNDPGAVGSGGAIRSATGEPPSITEPTGTWDAVSVEPAAPPPPRMLLGGAVQQNVPQGRARSDLTLAIGRTALGKAPPVNSDPQSLTRACVDKRRGRVTFCIESADWPAELQQFMRVDTVMYQGLNMISRYDNGVATRFYALFPSVNFEEIVRSLADALGEPSTVWNRTIAPLAQPRTQNPTVIWKAVNPETQAVSFLEIRQYDDTRGGFPDEQRGAVMLYRAQSGPIFPHVSALELMRLRPMSDSGQG